MESKLFPNEFDDLSYWEFVNSSDVEDGQSANADDDYDVEDSLYDGFGSWSSLSSSSTTNDESSSEAKDRVIEIQQVVEVVEPPPIMEVSEKVGNFNQVVLVYEQCSGDVAQDEVDLDDEDEDEDDEVDLDDELVPWGLNEKLGRGRMRKLGKRSYSKMAKAKRVAFTFDRPGCVHGKHGLGLKHSF